MSRRHKVPNAAATQAQAAQQQTPAPAKPKAPSASKSQSAGKQSQPANKAKANSKSTPARKQRTTLMTIAIALVFLHGLVATGIVAAYLYSIGGFGEVTKQVAFGLHAAAAVASVVAAVLLWYWKRIGIYVYAAAVIVSAALMIVLFGALGMGMVGAFAELIPAFIVLYIIYPKIKLFD